MGDVLSARYAQCLIEIETLESLDVKPIEFGTLDPKEITKVFAQGIAKAKVENDKTGLGVVSFENGRLVKTLPDGTVVEIEPTVRPS